MWVIIRFTESATHYVQPVHRGHGWNTTTIFFFVWPSRSRYGALQKTTAKTPGRSLRRRRSSRKYRRENVHRNSPHPEPTISNRRVHYRLGIGGSLGPARPRDAGRPRRDPGRPNFDAPAGAGAGTGTQGIVVRPANAAPLRPVASAVPASPAPPGMQGPTGPMGAQGPVGENCAGIGRIPADFTFDHTARIENIQCLPDSGTSLRDCD